jgi:hypothetical protein
VVQVLGWRGLFAVLAVASAAVALTIVLVVPDRKAPAQAAASPEIGYLAIYLDPRFLRVGPLAALGVGTSFSLQGLWAAPWLADVAGLDRPAVVEHLTLMAAALAASALLLGAVAERLRRAGIPTELILAAVLALSMAAQLALLLGFPVSSHLLFAVVASAGAATVLGFAVLAQYFPKEVSGRANAALGVLNMGTAFGLQCLSGFIVALWPGDGGRYPAEAHEAAMAAGLGLQLVALGVFFTPRRRVKPAPMAHAVARAMGFGQAPLPIARPVYMPWTYQEELVRRQRAAWRFAAAASAVLCVSLAAMLSMAISRPAIALHLIEVSRRMSDRMGDCATPPTPGAGPARAICTDPERGATAPTSKPAARTGSWAAPRPGRRDSAGCGGAQRLQDQQSRHPCLARPFKELPLDLYRACASVQSSPIMPSSVSRRCRPPRRLRRKAHCAGTGTWDCGRRRHRGDKGGVRHSEEPVGFGMAAISCLKVSSMVAASAS